MNQPMANNNDIYSQIMQRNETKIEDHLWYAYLDVSGCQYLDKVLVTC